MLVNADCVVYVELNNALSPPRLLQSRVITASAEQQATCLAQLAREFKLAKSDCHTVMPLGSYHLLLIEAPEVPPDELRAAVRWRIRELIDFHIDDAVLDVFDAPASAARGQTHLYVVVSRRDAVKGLAEPLQAAGIGLQVIDIPELALRNLAAQLPQDPQGVAMLYFGQTRGLIALCRNQTLYLARTLDLGEQRIQEARVDGHLESLYDAIALEVQRSLDYYDRHFQQAALSNLIIAPLSTPFDELPDNLHSRLGLTASFLDLNQVVEGAETLSQEQLSRGLLALGAALRSEPKSL